MEQIRARIELRRRAESARAADEAGIDAEPAGSRATRRRMESAAAADPRLRRAAALPPSEWFDFHGHSIYRSSRGGVGRVLYGSRRLLRPLLKFVFNIDPMVDALSTQARLNAQQTAFDREVARRLAAHEKQDVLSRRAVQDLTAEMQRLSSEMKNQRRLVESMSQRLGALEQAGAGEPAASPNGDRQPEKPAGDAPPSPPPIVETPPPNR